MLAATFTRRLFANAITFLAGQVQVQSGRQAAGVLVAAPAVE